MCVILLISHIPCAHTITIWQHCIDATRSGIHGTSPCWNVQQHDRAILTKTLCERCGGRRFFARRGGIAERGSGTPLTTPYEYIEEPDEDADDSGYHSDVVHEKDNDGVDEYSLYSLSPKSIVQPRQQLNRPTECARRHSKTRPPLIRRPSWTPRLKNELHLNAPASNRRWQSINMTSTTCESSLEKQPKHQEVASGNKQGVIARGVRTMPALYATKLRVRAKREPMNLDRLFPTTPTEANATLQTATAFPFPTIVHVEKPSKGQAKRTTPRYSILLHPASPFSKDIPQSQQNSKPQTYKPTRPAPPTRNGSTLLHPSCPTDNAPKDTQYKTILSVPPRQHPAADEEPHAMSPCYASLVSPHAGISKRSLDVSSPPAPTTPTSTVTTYISLLSHDSPTTLAASSTSQSEHEVCIETSPYLPSQCALPASKHNEDQSTPRYSV